MNTLSIVCLLVAVGCAVAGDPNMVRPPKDAIIMPVGYLPLDPPNCGFCTKIGAPVCATRYNKVTKRVEFENFGNRCMIGFENCQNPGNDYVGFTDDGVGCGDIVLPTYPRFTAKPVESMPIKTLPIRKEHITHYTIPFERPVAVAY